MAFTRELAEEPRSHERQAHLATLRSSEFGFFRGRGVTRRENAALLAATAACAGTVLREFG